MQLRESWRKKGFIVFSSYFLSPTPLHERTTATKTPETQAQGLKKNASLPRLAVISQVLAHTVKLVD